MALPKRKMSRSNTRHRRSQWKAVAPSLVNCANPHCNAHLPLCEACGQTLQGACSPACAEHPDKRPYDGTGAYPKLSNHYNPAQGLASYKPGKVRSEG